MKHKDYWTKRFEALEEAQMQKGTEYYARLEKQYRRAQRTVQKDIETWYARLAVNNELTLQGARKLLTADELEEFHWNVMEYIEKGRTLNISDQWAKHLENASAKFHISRLEAIKLQMQNHVEVLYGTEHDEFTDLMENIYTEGYYHTAYEIQKGFGIGYDLMRLDKNKVEKVLSKPWAADGSNFSSRIWTQKAQLVNELETHLTQAIIQGQNPSAVTDIIAKRFDVSKGRAGRLVMTEAAFFNSASNRDCYKELDVEQYEVLATLDRKTSDICQEMDGKVFKMSEYAVGLTAPPFHTWCRTTTVPFFDDEFELGSKRAARGDDGKTYFVPADMKYSDWKKTFVDGGSKDGLEIIGNGDKMKVVNAPTINNPKIKSAVEDFENKLLDSDGVEGHVTKMKFYNDMTEYELDEKSNAAFQYREDLDVITYNPNAPEFDLFDLNFVQAHELSHRMDILEYNSFDNQKFQTAIEKCRTKVADNADEIAKWFEAGGKYENEYAISDIISALSKNNIAVPVGHRDEYWEQSVNVSLELFANISAIDVLGSAGRDEFEGLLKELYAAYKEIVE